MRARLESDLLDDVVDQFEENWGEGSAASIDEFLQGFGVAEDSDFLVELVRVDIQRRYAADLPVDLDVYFSSHGDFLNRESRGVLIAYEDYRTRVSKSLPIGRGRWEWIDGVDDTDWFKSIEAEDPNPLTKGQAADSAKLLNPIFRGSGSSPQRSDSNRGTVERSSVASRSDINSLRVEPVDLSDAISEAGFTIVRQISTGAFSRVFLVTQDSLANRYVVIKAVLRAFREADRLAQLQHTNIVPIYSYHQCGRWFLICMPYTGLITLADYFESTTDSKLRSGQSFVSTIRQAVAEETLHCSDGTFPPEIGEFDKVGSDSSMSLQKLFSHLEPMQRNEFSLWMFSHLSAALSHAHARNILHGDLKPANILLRNDGEPALLDFNLSADLDGKEATSVGGTLGYMAPELLSAMIGAEHRRAATSDIYSIGAVYFQFLTGRPCHLAPRSSAPIDIELAIADRRKPLRWQANDNVSPGIVAIVTKCLAYSAEDRYQTAEQLHEDIERERHLLPLKHARERSLKHRCRKWFKRHPLLTSVGTLASLAIVVISCLSLSLWSISEHRRSLVARTEFTRFEDQSRQALAGMLVVGRPEREQALVQADKCLDRYRVLSDLDWQRRPEWAYMDQESMATAERRLTDLLLRTSWVRYEQVTAELNGQPIPSGDNLHARVKLLSAKPFASHAPVSIEHLKRTIGVLPSDSADSTSTWNESTATPLDILGRASQAIDHLDSMDALRLLQPDLLKFVDPYAFWVTLGRAQTEAGYLPSAELSFSMALESCGESPAAYHYRGDCRMRMRNSAKTASAIADFNAALDRAGHSYATRIALALAKESMGKLRGAIKVLERLSGTPELDASALLVRSRVYRKLQQHELSKRDFDSAIDMTPRTVGAWQSRALARLPDDPEGAMEDLRAAQKLSPNSVEVLQNMAHVYSEHLHAPEQAIDSLTSLLRINPSFENALLGRAVLLARMGEGDRALKDLRLAESSRSQLAPASIYQAACVYALLSQDPANEESQTRSVQAALSYLSRAIQETYGSDLLASDPDLDPLRNDQRFQTILEVVALGKTNQRSL